MWNFLGWQLCSFLPPPPLSRCHIMEKLALEHHLRTSWFSLTLGRPTSGLRPHTAKVKLAVSSPPSRGCRNTVWIKKNASVVSVLLLLADIFRPCGIMQRRARCSPLWGKSNWAEILRLLELNEEISSSCHFHHPWEKHNLVLPHYSKSGFILEANPWSNLMHPSPRAIYVLYCPFWFFPVSTL